MLESQSQIPLTIVSTLTATPGNRIARETSEFLKMTTTALDLPGTMPRTRALKE